MRSDKSHMFIALISFVLVTLFIHAESREKKIRGGFEVTNAEVGTFVVIVIYGEYACSGSIVGNFQVLTSAHCTCNPDPVSHVVLYKTSESQPTYTSIRVSETIEHPDLQNVCIKSRKEGLDFTMSGSDIALVELEAAYNSEEFSATIISLELEESSNYGLEVLVYGFGLDEHENDPEKIGGILKYGQLKLNECKNEMPKMLCIYTGDGKENYQLPNIGDGGGPLVDEKTKNQIGVSIGGGENKALFASTYDNRDFLSENL